ncbi:MAG TPA: hypothetical protein VJ656_13625 [Pyrinomonadaceae bacterium]|nr:hypothetical protein [Pyrinomonadaceae bacterium]
MGKRVLIFLLVLCGMALFAAPSQSENGRERVQGTFVSMSGRTSGRTRPFTLTIDRYTPPNQLRELNEALSRGGQDELLKVMSKMDAGRVQIGTGVGVDANAVIVDPWGDGGRKITVLYERWLQFFELRYGTRSQDYKVGYAEIYLDRNGRGEGTLIPAARVRLKGGNTWEVEDFGVFPARLLGLRSSGRVVPR